MSKSPSSVPRSLALAEKAVSDALTSARCHFGCDVLCDTRAEAFSIEAGVLNCVSGPVRRT